LVEVEGGQYLVETSFNFHQILATFNFAKY
jgi:hypothetical protein